MASGAIRLKTAAELAEIDAGTGFVRAPATAFRLTSRR